MSAAIDQEDNQEYNDPYASRGSFASKQSGDKRGNWIVDDYFCEGERKEPWIDQIVVKYHRTIEHYFIALKQAGFSVLDLREGTPKREHFSSEEEFIRRQ